jgi:hypothetical protein
MQALKKASVVTVMASVLFVAGGCGSFAERNESSGAPSEEPPQIAASAETKRAFGVDHWSRQERTGHTVISGEDGAGTVRVRFEQLITTDSAGVTHGLVTANIDGSPMLRYVVSADGHGRVERNDFPTSPHAVEAARDALSDVGGSGGSLVQTKSLAPLDLVKPGSPLLSTGAGRCGAAIAATICIVAALCGLGGPSGAEVLAATVEAGTEQCE